MDRQMITDLLGRSPDMLRGLMEDVPKDLLKERRKPGKWSAHEHACHIARVQETMNARLRRFLTEDRPVFASYVPGKTTPEDELTRMDLARALDDFAAARAEFLSGLRGAADWGKQGEHPEYSTYSLGFMARHLLLHDYVHMFRIEEVAFTRDLARR